MKPPRMRATMGLFRFHTLGFSVAILLALFGLAISSEAHREELIELQHDSKVSKVEKALKSLEAKLNEVGPSPEHVAWQSSHGSSASPLLSDVSDGDVVMHAAPESSGYEKPLHPEEATHRVPGEAWTAADQSAYDAEMTRALGFSGPTPKEDHMPAMFLPLASLPLQRDYAHNLVRVLQNMKQGYVEELVQWAVGGHKGENPFITPIVETLEAPLIKDLDKEAHRNVESTVADLAKRSDLSAAQMKSMRARLLVPLLLRIRARVHQQVQTYVVSMLRRIILYGSQWKGKENFNEHGILAPEGGSAHHASDDEHMEHTLRDIDALYEKGVLSKRDYEAEKAKLLSDWLGLAIKHIGGKKKARKALEEFLWPPVYTVKGCRCMLPFQFNVEQIGNKPITYDECTDIPNPQMANITGKEQIPGPGWCAVDPDDVNCGTKSDDPRAFIGEGGYGWTNWDVCKSQPPPRDGQVVPADSSVKVITEHGCTCQLPFEVYPLNLGGRIKKILTTCTKLGGTDADWCPTVGSCGRSGVPTGLAANSNLSWTNWDRCIGEPAGYLASATKKIKTRQGCTCRESWEFRPATFTKSVTYGGCTDIDSPGTAWCAVEGDDCGEAKKEGGSGWTRWDVCEDAEQPDEVIKELEAKILPTPAPIVRTQDGCTCKLPYAVAADETNNKAVTIYTCNRFGRAAAWCPVQEGDCGQTGEIPGVRKVGWQRWDLCVGEEAGFLPPLKPRVETKAGCVCKLPFKFHLFGEAKPTIYTEPTDIDSPNQPWCAVDPELSRPGCGTKSTDPNAGFGPGKYGWDHWDELPNKVTPIARGALPPANVEVRTALGCTCKLPYSFSPPGVGETLTFNTCNRYDQGKVGLSNWWCLVEEEGCGRPGPNGNWDTCIGLPAGYLEPEPIKTTMGCECAIPFIYSPPAFARKDCGPACGPKKMIYTGCTDIDQRAGEGAVAPAWCATRDGCGKVDTTPGAAANGWKNWDTCLPSPAAPQAAAVAPVVRTQNGCRCKLPFRYAPMDTCSFAQETPAGCTAKGGDMVSGWCVVCKVETFTACTYLDQADDTAWCAVEGKCGVESKDENALKSVEQGGYGWTHWDRCIGEAAGYIGIDKPYAQLFPPGGVVNGSLHLLASAPAARLHNHRKRSAPAGAAPHHPAEAAAAVAAVEAAKGRGRRGRVGGGKGDEIKALEKEMAHTLHALNAKLSKLDDAPPAASKPNAAAHRGPTGWASVGLAAGLAVVLAAAGPRV